MRYVPQGVMPPAQLLSVPMTCLPVGSALVFIRSWPAAGPSMTIGVLSGVMRRLYLESSTGAHLPSEPRAISMTVPPWAAISMSTSSRVISEKPFLFCWPKPGNIISSFVYSWLTHSRPRELSGFRGTKPT